MKIKSATKRYEDWVAAKTPLDTGDLDTKHTLMAAGVFPFLRATFFRWIQVWPQVCPDLNAAPVVLSVGDLHIENFGTWRDSEGRLVWGINDFDEAYPLAYTHDLVRLAVSASMAMVDLQIKLPFKNACDAILAGYTESLKIGGGPFILAEKHKRLRELATSNLRDPVRYWEKLNGQPTITEAIPQDAAQALEAALPETGLVYRVVRRFAGLGSRGHQRFVAIADWRGGKIAREVKALKPSACLWARNDHGTDEIHYAAILKAAVRVPDPTVRVQGNWIVRRLAPDCSKIEIGSIPKERDEFNLLLAMGWETANIHLGSTGAKAAILQDLEKRPSGWLPASGKEMEKAVISDWKEWKKS